MYGHYFLKTHLSAALVALMPTVDLFVPTNPWYLDEFHLNAIWMLLPWKDAAQGHLTFCTNVTWSCSLIFLGLIAGLKIGQNLKCFPFPVHVKSSGDLGFLSFFTYLNNFYCSTLFCKALCNNASVSQNESILNGCIWKFSKCHELTQPRRIYCH